MPEVKTVQVPVHDVCRMVKEHHVRYETRRHCYTVPRNALPHRCRTQVCRMVKEDHVRYETRCVTEHVPEQCVRQVPVTTCRMVCEQRQCVVRQCRVNYVCEERVPLRAAHDLQGDPRDVLPDGAAHDLHDGAVHGQLLREALRAGVRAGLPAAARDPKVVVSCACHVHPPALAGGVALPRPTCCDPASVS